MLSRRRCSSLAAAGLIFAFVARNLLIHQESLKKSVLSNLLTKKPELRATNNIKKYGKQFLQEPYASNKSSAPLTDRSKNIFLHFPYPKTCRFEQPLHGIGIAYDIALFYHVGMKNSWKDIVWDQLDTLESCGLGYMASSLTVSYSKPDGENYTVDDIVGIFNQFSFITRLNLSYIEAKNPPVERDIMESIHRTCILSKNEHQNEGGPNHLTGEKKLMVFYFHSKGISYSPETDVYNNVLHWRKYMEWFLYEKPTLCLRALLHHGALTCGVNWNSGISWHYSGNFWAASCDWIVNLPATVQVPPGDPYGYTAAERWIGAGVIENDHFKFVNLFDSGTLGNPYEIPFLPESYTNLDGHLNGNYSSDIVGNYSNLWVEYFENVSYSK
jgi:hypothetical protein